MLVFMAYLFVWRREKELDGYRSELDVLQVIVDAEPQGSSADGEGEGVTMFV
jgi:hypothetical protein